MSKSGEFIFMVIYADDSNLRVTAENDQMIKRMSFSLTDLLSLEPVDRRMRPLRVHPILWNDLDYIAT
jgi:hypothetical protein